MPLQQFTSLQDFQAQNKALNPQRSQPFSATALRNVHRRADRSRELQICAAIKKRADKHIVCSKTLIAKKGQEKRVQKKCQEILDFSLGKAANKSNGILEFTCSKDLYEPNVFHFWERYDGNVNLGRHNTTPEFQKFMEGVQDLLEEPIGLALYAYKDGQISNVCVQGGPKGEGGLDDATGASKSAGGGASMKQTSQTVNLGKIKRGDEGDSFGMGFRFPWQKKKEEEEEEEEVAEKK